MSRPAATGVTGDLCTAARTGLERERNRGSVRGEIDAKVPIDLLAAAFYHLMPITGEPINEAFAPRIEEAVIRFTTPCHPTVRQLPEPGVCRCHASADGRILQASGVWNYWTTGFPPTSTYIGPQEIDMHPRPLPGLIAVLAIALAACSAADGVTVRPLPSSPSGIDDPAPSPTPPPSDDNLAMDWSRAFTLHLANGWTVRDCEGDRMDACVYDGDVMLGDVELLTGYPLDERQTGQDEATVLAELASGFLEHFREDRAAGCPGFEFVADDVQDTTVGGQPAKRAAFSLLDSNGQVVERVINHFTLQGDSYAIVNTDAYAIEGGCLGPSEYDASFAPGNLVRMEEYLDRLVAGSPLPATPTS